MGSSLLLFYMLCFIMLYYQIQNKKHLKFDIEQKCVKWIKNGLWQNTIICSQLSGHKSEEYLKTGFKYRYDLLCDVDAYYKTHPSGPDNASIGVGRSLSNTSYTDALESLGNIIKFIDHCPQFFSENYVGITYLYKVKMKYIYSRTHPYLFL